MNETLASLVLLPLIISAALLYICGIAESLKLLRAFRAHLGALVRHAHKSIVRPFRHDMQACLYSLRRESTSTCLRKYGEAID
jgi:hypothetical protein